MRLLLSPEVTTVTGAGLAAQFNALSYKVQQEIVPRVLAAEIDPYGGMVTLRTLLGKASLPVPSQVLGVLTKLP